MNAHTTDQPMILGVEAKDDQVRIFTRCPEHGEHEIIIPIDHLAALSQVMTLTLIRIRGIDGMIDLLLSHHGLKDAMAHLPEAQREPASPHQRLSDEAVQAILKNFTPSTAH